MDDYCDELAEAVRGFTRTFGYEKVVFVLGAEFAIGHFAGDF